MVTHSYPWYLYEMVTHNKRKCGGSLFFENELTFWAQVDLNKCLKQVKLQILIKTPAHFFFESVMTGDTVNLTYLLL